MDGTDRTKQITVGLTAEQINGLLGYLVERPCKEVYGLVAMLIERQNTLQVLLKAANAKTIEMARARITGNGQDPDSPTEPDVERTDKSPSH